MGLLDWMKRGNVKREAGVFLSHEERWALRRMTQHCDEGLVACRQGGEWEKTFNAMAQRLALRLRDPLGDRPVAISSKEAEALDQFQKLYERNVHDVYPGNEQMKSDACSVRDALDRGGRPGGLPALTVQPEGAERSARRHRSGWER